MSYTMTNKKYNRVYVYRVWLQDGATGETSEAYFENKQRAEQYKQFMEACGCMVSMNVWRWEMLIEQ